MSLKDLKEDKEFMQKHKAYHKLVWEKIKKRMILDFADVPIIILALITSVAISILIYAYLFSEIVYPLTSDEFLLVFSNPTVILAVFGMLSLISILVFTVVVAIILFTINHYAKREQLKKELEEA